jgi:hypothetical protein
VEGDVGVTIQVRRRDPQIEHGGANADHGHPAIRILGWKFVPRIAVHFDGVAPEPEPPWLGVVHRRRKDRRTDEVLSYGRVEGGRSPVCHGNHPTLLRAHHQCDGDCADRHRDGKSWHRFVAHI